MGSRGSNRTCKLGRVGTLLSCVCVCATCAAELLHPFFFLSSCAARANMPLRALRLISMASSSLASRHSHLRISMLPPSLSRPLSFLPRSLKLASSPPRISPLVASSFDHVADNPGGVAPAPGGFRRPETIEYQKELVNQVSLIGVVGRDVDIRYLDSGKVVANCSMKVPRFSLNADKEDMWFFLEFWDELAEIAAAHLKRNEHIFVSGSVWQENYTDKDNLQRKICKVKAKELKYVSSWETSVEKTDPKDLWKNYFNNPSEWWDNRLNKRNPKAPDFKNKTTGAPLWIDSVTTPAWVKAQIQGHDAKEPSFVNGDSIQGERSNSKDNGDFESLWKSYFANPSEWWDNRDAKKNPKAPDFKHKISGAALWIDSYSNPSWVKAQFEGHDAKEPSHVNVAGEWSNMKNDAQLESLWKTFLANPSEWWDNRDTKKSPRSPDFKHKTTGEALWINGCPDWVRLRLEVLASKSQTPKEEERNAGHSSSSKELDNSRSISEEELQFL